MLIIVKKIKPIIRSKNKSISWICEHDFSNL